MKILYTHRGQNFYDKVLLFIAMICFKSCGKLRYSRAHELVLRVRNGTVVLIVFVCVFLTTADDVKAQQHISNEKNIWIDNSTKFSWNDNWGSSQYISLRRNDYLRNWQQSLFRLSVDYNYSKSLELSQGLDRVMNYPYGAFPIRKKTLEYRVFQQVSKSKELKGISAMIRFKLETRFVGWWYAQSVNNRVRSKLELNKKIGQWPSNSSSLHLWMFDEIFINVANPTQLEMLSQNWSYFGLRYSYGKDRMITLGLMDQYVRQPDGKRVENNLTFAFGYFVNFGLLKMT